VLTQAQVDAFQRDGFVFPVPVFGEREAAQWASDVLALAATDLPGHDLPWHQKTYLLLPSLDDLLRDRRLTDPVADILGPDLLALSADVFLKPAHNPRRITWHQDVNYWRLDPLDMLTAWVAFTPAGPANGGMRYSRGGHHARIGFAIRYAATSVRQTGGPPISARVARGTDAFGHFALEDGPEGRIDDRALAAHRRALAPHESTGFSTV
jgi:hypothetical protein